MTKYRALVVTDDPDEPVDEILEPYRKTRGRKSEFAELVPVPPDEYEPKYAMHCANRYAIGLEPVGFREWREWQDEYVPQDGALCKWENPKGKWSTIGDLVFPDGRRCVTVEELVAFGPSEEDAAYLGDLWRRAKMNDVNHVCAGINEVGMHFDALLYAKDEAEFVELAGSVIPDVVASREDGWLERYKYPPNSTGEWETGFKEMMLEKFHDKYVRMVELKS